MNPIIEKALGCLENANYAGYFDEIDKISIPKSLKTIYATYKGKFIAGKDEWNFDQQLRAFSSELNKQLEENQQIDIRKNTQQPKEKMNTTHNFTTSDLHEQTYVFLFGTSKYAEDSELSQMLNVEVNLKQLYEVFTKEQGIKKENIRSFLNQTGDDIKHELCTILEEISPKSTFIFYFAGHGVLGEKDHKLYFTTPKSRTKTIQGTGILASSIREIISNYRIDRKIIILDCCFSGDFNNKMASIEQTVRIEISSLAEKIKGYFVITSSERTKTSLFDSKNPNRPTYFTESIIQTLKEGIKGKEGFLTTSDVYENIKYLYQESEIDLPRPTHRADNEGDNIIFAINRNNQSKPQETKTNTNDSAKVEEEQIISETKREVEMPQVNKKELKNDLSEDIGLFFEKMENIVDGDLDKENSLLQKKNKLKRLKKDFKDELITKEAYDIGCTKVERYLLEMIDELN
ncbi:caspase family protein [Bernardetia sp. MNP-M8]|uniref:caspase family protein n=1 Tax=Bernardetia sp. MNP-M8 TaxID=3127470 RepID=UPI0030D516C6